MNYQGDYFEDSILQVSFTTNDAAGGAIAPSAPFTTADIKIYKDGSATPKATTNGVTIASPFASIVGQHQVGIDTSINTGDVGFWTAGSDYKVTLEPIPTVDGQTVTAIPATFSIENRNMRGTDNAALPSDLSALALETTSQDILDQVTGTGNRAITINVKDDGANNLQDVLVRIGEASRYTDVLGNAVFALDDGSYDVILRKNLVSFTVPESLTVAGDGTHPYIGTLVVPSAPTQPDTCVVYGTVIDNSGAVVTGADISIKETNDSTFSNAQKLVKPTSTTSDANGFWQLEIIRSSELDPDTSSYEAIITYGDGAFRYVTSITVPDADSVEFSTIINT